MDERFWLNIRLGNAGMGTPYDVGLALRKLGGDLMSADLGDGEAFDGAILDDNGNTVGRWNFDGGIGR